MKQDNKEHKTYDKILISSAHTVSRRKNTGIKEAECFRIYVHLLGAA
jgi:hypothetical protein